MIAIVFGATIISLALTIVARMLRLLWIVDDSGIRVRRMLFESKASRLRDEQLASVPMLAGMKKAIADKEASGELSGLQELRDQFDAQLNRMRRDRASMVSELNLLKAAEKLEASQRTLQNVKVCDDSKCTQVNPPEATFCRRCGKELSPEPELANV